MSVLPTNWRRKPAGINMEQNYVTYWYYFSPDIVKIAGLTLTCHIKCFPLEKNDCCCNSGCSCQAASLWRESRSHLMHGLLVPPESTSQTAPRSVQPFLRSSRLSPTDKHTNTHREYRPKRAHLCTACMRCGLKRHWPFPADRTRSLRGKHRLGRGAVVSVDLLSGSSLWQTRTDGQTRGNSQYCLVVGEDGLKARSMSVEK